MACDECAALRARAERAERERDALALSESAAVDRQIRADSEAQSNAQRAERAEEALRLLTEEFADALPYVPDYFREKWGYDDALAAARLVLGPRTVAAQLADGGADATAPTPAKLLKPEPAPADVVAAFFAEKEGR